MFSNLSEPKIFARPARETKAWNLPGADVAFEGGRRALRAGVYAPARAIFQALLPHEPDHPEVLIALSRTVMESGNPKLAEVLLEGLDRKSQRTSVVQVLRAECALLRGETAKGLSRAFACAEAYPSEPHSRFLTARMLWLGGQESSAEVQFLTLASAPEVGARACAWAVFCGWRQGHREEVGDLLVNLRPDDVVCEGLREFGHRALDIPWNPSDRVDPTARQSCADSWNGLYHRDYASTLAIPKFTDGRIFV